MESESFYRALFYRAAGFRYRGIAATPMFETVSVKNGDASARAGAWWPSLTTAKPSAARTGLKMTHR